MPAFSVKTQYAFVLKTCKGKEDVHMCIDETLDETV